MTVPCPLPRRRPPRPLGRHTAPGPRRNTSAATTTTTTTNTLTLSSSSSNSNRNHRRRRLRFRRRRYGCPAYARCCRNVRRPFSDLCLVYCTDVNISVPDRLASETFPDQSRSQGLSESLSVRLCHVTRMPRFPFPCLCLTRDSLHFADLSTGIVPRRLRLAELCVSIVA
ncbi:hypothetical protein BKA62DRAFT_321763 [Auriculariales sp. MPI-PUGE-AT-0066]|nr:hypothetical protein BKA62DRAFT_321763 [Auriculariales sp. MPI-PUGE-AT-0066]